MSVYVTVAGAFDVRVEVDDFDVEDDEQYDERIRQAIEKVENGDFDIDLLTLEPEDGWL